MQVVEEDTTTREIPDGEPGSRGHDDGMDTPEDMPTSSVSRRRPVAASLAALAVAVTATIGVGVVTAIEQAAHPPTCYGIGFGCTPDAITTALLVGGIFGLPALAVAWAATWVGWALTRERSDRTNRTAAWWPVWPLAVGVGVLAVVVATG